MTVRVEAPESDVGVVEEVKRRRCKYAYISRTCTMGAPVHGGAGLLETTAKIVTTETTETIRDDGDDGADSDGGDDGDDIDDGDERDDKDNRTTGATWGGG